LCFGRIGALWVASYFVTFQALGHSRPGACWDCDGAGRCDTDDDRWFKAKTMTPFDVVLADISRLELARATLPAHSHIAALFELTLHRLREEADVLHRVQLNRAG
jgi:hypothetical protein